MFGVVIIEIVSSSQRGQNGRPGTEAGAGRQDQQGKGGFYPALSSDLKVSSPKRS